MAPFLFCLLLHYYWSTWRLSHSEWRYFYGNVQQGSCIKIKQPIPTYICMFAAQNSGSKMCLIENVKRKLDFYAYDWMGRAITKWKPHIPCIWTQDKYVVVVVFFVILIEYFIWIWSDGRTKKKKNYQQSLEGKKKIMFIQWK